MLLADAHTGTAAHAGTEVGRWRRGTAGSIPACVLLLEIRPVCCSINVKGLISIEVQRRWHLQDAGHGW